jgi:predicted dehydrogenase
MATKAGATRVGIVGYGKIAQDQHVPSIEGNPHFELAATVSRSGNGHPGVPCFATHTDMLREVKDLGAVSVCTPPSVRYAITRDCLEAGLPCLLEKPPGVTLGEVDELRKIADAKGLTLFTTWHAQHNPPVAAAAEALTGKTVESMHIAWREDVRKWHPGQAWIWEPGGFGVFDPGINAFSIATRIFPGTLWLKEAELFYPANRQSPIAANLALLGSAATGPITAEFDWRHSGGECWNIEVKATDGTTVFLSDGGSKLKLNGEDVAAQGPGEYPDIYREFAELLDGRKSHVDVAPLRLCAEAFLLGRRTIVDAFED